MKMDRKMRRNTAIIAGTFFLSGFNYLAAGILGVASGARESWSNILFGFVLVGLGIMRIYDEREEMHSMAEVVFSCGLYFTLGVILVATESLWWVTAYVTETVSALGVYCIIKRIRRKKH